MNAKRLSVFGSGKDKSVTNHRIALVGIGKIAVDQHVPAISGIDGLELAATVSRNAALEGIESFPDLDKMLAARPDIDIVSLAIPPVPRFGYAAAAIKAGRNVMLEKPPGASLAECLTLQRMAEDAGVTLYATWHSRHAHAVGAAKRWLEGRRIRDVSVVWKEDVRRWHPGQDWIWQAGGLGVFDPGINALSILTEILPDRVHLNGAELEFPENRDTPIAAQLRFHHSDGAKVTAEFDWRQEGPQTWDITVTTDDGTMKLSQGGAVLHIDEVLTEQGEDREYASLYNKMVQLVESDASEMDLDPMIHVSDAFTLGKRITVAPFDW